MTPTMVTIAHFSGQTLQVHLLSELPFVSGMFACVGESAIRSVNRAQSMHAGGLLAGGGGMRLEALEKLPSSKLVPCGCQRRIPLQKKKKKSGFSSFLPPPTPAATGVRFPHGLYSWASVVQYSRQYSGILLVQTYVIAHI
ncbi:UNVERIFIED_CONTAM: hypothetical protein K2H54_031052 [Gekko kuhli]